MSNPGFTFFPLVPGGCDVVAARRSFTVVEGQHHRKTWPVIVIHREATYTESGVIDRPAEAVNYAGPETLLALRAAIDHALSEPQP